MRMPTDWHEISPKGQRREEFFEADLPEVQKKDIDVSVDEFSPLVENAELITKRKKEKFLSVQRPKFNGQFHRIYPGQPTAKSTDRMNQNG
jgi:hypothetical protein